MKFFDIKSNRSLIIVIVAIFVLTVFVGVRAGSLTPPGNPASTFYTLGQIFNPLASDSYDSSGFSANSNGSLIQMLKYINANMPTSSWTVSGNNIYNANTRFVGIGTGANPTTKLEVQGTASASYFLTGNTIQVGGYASVAYNRFGTAATTHSNFIGASNDVLISGDLEIDASAQFDSFLKVGTNTLYANPTTDRVGIGTVAPSAKLSVVGAADVQQTIVVANSTQNANISEWQDSSGNIGFAVQPGPGTPNNPREYLRLSEQVQLSGSAAGSGYAKVVSQPISADTASIYRIEPKGAPTGVGAGLSSLGAHKAHIELFGTDFDADNNNYDRFIIGDFGSADVFLTGDFGTGAAKPFVFGRWNENTGTLTEWMRINTTGYVGIGTTTPSTKLDVSGAGKFSGELITADALQVGSATSAAYSRFGTATTNHANYISASNDVLISADLEVRATASFAGVASVGGNFFVNLPTSSSATNPCIQSVNGTWQFVQCTSSIRYKENIAPLDFDTSKLFALQPVKFTYKIDDKPGVGFIAEDVYKEIPALVYFDAQGEIGGINYQMFAPYLVTALKEHEQRLNLLETIGGAVKTAVATFQRLVAHIIETDQLTVKQGIMIKDSVTGDYYCVTVADGTLKTTAGTCESPSSEPSPLSSSSLPLPSVPSSPSAETSL